MIGLGYSVQGIEIVADAVVPLLVVHLHAATEDREVVGAETERGAHGGRRAITKCPHRVV
jgi:hypothetical protein